MVRMMRGNRGRGSRGFFPVQMMQPNQRLMPANSVQPPFYSNTRVWCVCVYQYIYVVEIGVHFGYDITKVVRLSHLETYFDAKQCGEEPLPSATYVEVQATSPHTFPPPSTIVTQGQILPKPNKNRVQVCRIAIIYRVQYLSVNHCSKHVLIKEVPFTFCISWQGFATNACLCTWIYNFCELVGLEMSQFESFVTSISCIICFSTAQCLNQSQYRQKVKQK